jgi:hypothetical protein
MVERYLDQFKLVKIHELSKIFYLVNDFDIPKSTRMLKEVKVFSGNKILFYNLRFICMCQVNFRTWLGEKRMISTIY